MAEFRMPSLGADMDVGTIIEWLVVPGQLVTRGQVVAVVDTAKAAIEIECFEDGILESILVGPGAQVPVGTPIAMIAPAPAGARVALPTVPELVVDAVRPMDRIDHPLKESSQLATPPVRHLAHQLGVDLDQVVGTGPGGHLTHDDVVAAAAGAVAAGAAVEAAGRVRATPRARRLAVERGVELDDVAGSGARGAVLAEDVLAIARRPTARSASHLAGTVATAATGTAGPGGVPPAAGTAPATAAASLADRKAAMRTAIATLMSRSNAEIPHYYVRQTIDMAPALAWLAGRNVELPAARRLLPAVLFLRATVLAALAVPDLNGHWVDGELHPAERVDLGVAVATRGGGLVTPAIPDAGPMQVEALMARLADLVGRARRGALRQAEMAGASITVSSLGEAGPDELFGVIFPPQVALVGVGGIVERPWAVDGMLTVRPTATVVLAADHRASDGRTASTFLARFCQALAHPEEL